eukprot:TRINITY_DN29552_c0_g1_i1.p3 TRINITY_DN29552_c0_g1~~TRINITY_DN29552_c0_g1_i1.p3  ORF type:complete len:128 (-),score=13.95 TRINITY_DN29552_c0_g1_i1:179-562(-)
MQSQRHGREQNERDDSLPCQHLTMPTCVEFVYIPFSQASWCMDAKDYTGSDIGFTPTPAFSNGAIMAKPEVALLVAAHGRGHQSILRVKLRRIPVVIIFAPMDRCAAPDGFASFATRSDLVAVLASF